MTNPPFFDPELGVFGGALETNGLTNFGAIFPLGALMFGLVWPCDGIWVNCEPAITTIWTAEAAIVTVWDPCEDPIVTVWTDATNDNEC